MSRSCRLAEASISVVAKPVWETVVRHLNWCDLSESRHNVLAKCHEIRNLGEYEGDLNISDRLIADLIAACRAVAAKLDALKPPAEAK